MPVGQSFWANPYAWSESGPLFDAAAAQRGSENQQAQLLGDYVRQMALLDYQMSGIVPQTRRGIGDFMNQMAERGTVWGGSALRGLGDISAGGVGQYLNPLVQGGQATGNFTLGSAQGYEGYGNALNQALLGGASNTAGRYLGAAGF